MDASVPSAVDGPSDEPVGATVEDHVADQSDGPVPTVPVLPPGSDGSRRRRTAFMVVGAAVAAGLVGGVIGNRIQSPADRAAERAGPIPSLITVPVERRALSSELTLNGTVEFNEPTVVQLAGGVGVAADEAAVVTDIRQTGDTIQEGDTLMEVTGRPVLVLQGDLPMYRRLVIGSEGPDVIQLEAALIRLGFDVGTADSVFDNATAAAVEQMYGDAGYTAEGPSIDERDALTSAQEFVRQAEENLRAAQQAVTDASRPMLESERLQLERSLQSAKDAVPAAQEAAQATRDAADREVAAARAARDTARVTRDASAALRDTAQQGAIDPDTNQPYSAERVAALQIEAAQAQQALVDAEGALASSESQRARSISDADASVADAQFQLTLTQTQYNETTAAGDTTELTKAVEDAQANVDDAQSNLTALQAATGLRISPGEIVFVPVLPSTLTESYVGLGSTVQGPVGTLATSSTLVTARVSRVDSALVAVGAPVTVDIRGSGVTTTGTVLSVGAPTAQPTNGDSGFGGPSAPDTSGRLVVTVAPDDPAVVSQYVFWDARVVVSVAATDGKVLVVPVAALTVGPDQANQVEVERTPATDDAEAVTEVVEVEVGLTANGLAEVRPIEDGALAEGDRVVVGVETNERLNEDDSSGPAVPSDEGDTPPTSDGTDDSGSADDGSSDTSSLAALLGFDFDPVESRRQQLKVEELTADCMRDEGFEYQPVDYSTLSNPEDDLQFSDPVKFGEQYGYGIMRSYELYEVGGGPVGPDFVDPNQEYLNNLSPDEQNAYYAALYGQPTEDFASDVATTEAVAGDSPVGTSSVDGVYVEPPPEERGCSGIAQDQVFGNQAMNDPAIQEALSSYYESLSSDPRLDDATTVWATCMAPTFDERGTDPVPESPDGMYSVIEQLKVEAQGLEAIAVSSQAEMDEYFNSGEPVYSATSDENGKGFVYLGEPEELSGEEIDRLTAIEVEFWTADHACQEEAGFAEIQKQIETDIVEQLLSQFPQLGD